jgi:hypothetical protein
MLDRYECLASAVRTVGGPGVGRARGNHRVAADGHDARVSSSPSRPVHPPAILQSAAGNAAVVQLLAVQRCGPVAIDRASNDEVLQSTQWSVNCAGTL